MIIVKNLIPIEFIYLNKLKNKSRLEEKRQKNKSNIKLKIHGEVNLLTVEILTDLIFYNF